MAAPADKPFGDDEDANQAVRECLSLVSDLSVQSRRLARTDFRNSNARALQAGLVREIRERIESRARAVFVDPAALIEAALAHLKRVTGRTFAITPAPTDRPGLDDTQMRLEGEILQLEEMVESQRAAAKRAQTRLSNLEHDLSEKRKAAARHRAAMLGRKAA